MIKIIGGAKMSIIEKPYGKMPDGRKVFMYTLKNRNGMKAEIINYGGIIVSLTAPDRDGNMSDVILGFDNLDSYIDKAYISSLIGRYANRIENSEFTLNGIKFKLSSNEGRNQLHGGLSGFNKKVWDARILFDGKDARLELSCFSPDGEEGFPGNLETRVIYTLTDENALEIEYYAVSDKDTVVNLTNHAYFNLSGYDSGTILSHQLQLNADFYNPIDSECIPTGEILSVKNTPFDFTKFKAIGDELGRNTDNEQLKNGTGYDHNFVLNVSGEEPEEAAQLYDPASGRLLKLLTTKPGVQLYTGNHLKGTGIGKGGIRMDKWQGLCLETQYFPNSMKYRHFPSPILRAGKTYHHVTIFRFETK
jgi:aldose 1-epimerase